MKRLVLALIMVASVAGRAVADDALPLPSPHVKMTGDGELTTNGKRFFLPLGTHILDGTTFDKLDKEVHRLQTQETRLTAERDSLSGGLGWGTVFVVTLGALALGFTVNHFVQ